MQGLFDEFCATLMIALGHTLWQGAAATIASAAIASRLPSARLRFNLFLACLLGITACVPINLWAVSKFRARAGRVGSSSARVIDASTTSPSAIVVDARSSSSAPRVQHIGTPLPPTTSAFTLYGEVPWADQALNYLFVAYLLGVAAMTLRLMIGLSATRRLRRGAIALEDETIQETVRRVCPSLNTRLESLVYGCSTITTPVIVGVLKPTILLPACLLTNLSPNELEMILLHELAHLHRRDPWLQIVQRVIEVLFFFHPAVWWLSRSLSIERENCCDDLAVRWGSDPCDLAEALVHVSELKKQSRAPFLALAATGGGSSALSRRVRRLLGLPVSNGLAVSSSVPAILVPLLVSAVVIAGPQQTEPTKAQQQQRAAVEASAPRTKHKDSNASANTFTLSGHVADSQGRRLRNVTLVVQRFDRLRGVASLIQSFTANGEFSLEVPVPTPRFADLTNWRTLLIHSPGHPAQAIQLQRLMEDHADLKNIEVRLPAPATVKYRVLGPDGTPCENAIVYPHHIGIRVEQFADGILSTPGLKSDGTSVPEELLDSVASKTDRDGWVTLNQIHPDDVDRFCVKTEAFGTQEFRVADDPAKRVEQHEVRLGRIGSIRGRVEMENVELVAGTTVSLETSGWYGKGVEQRGQANVVLDENGEFFVPEIAIGSGSLRFRGWDMSLPLQPLLERGWSVHTNQETVLRIKTAPVVTVRGRVLLEDSVKPVAGASVAINNLDSPLSSRTETDADGRFALPVAPGRCNVQLTSLGRDHDLYEHYDYPRFDHLIIKRFGPKEIQLDPCNVPRRARVLVRLQDSGGNRVPNARIGFQPIGANWFRHTGDTDADGECELGIADWKLMRGDRRVANRHHWRLIKNGDDSAPGTWDTSPLRVIDVTDETLTLEVVASSTNEVTAPKP
ncbi:MAG: M56 family metallopeptidase [Planctomycetota bacterium]